MRKILSTLTLLVVSFCAFAQSRSAEKTVTFTFKSGDAVFYGKEVPGNTAKLEELFAYLSRYESNIAKRMIRIEVDAYSTSGSSKRANKNLSFERANRVKSELIEKKGLREELFHTRNLTERYNNQPDVVVVTVHLPQIAAVLAREPAPQPEPERTIVSEPEPVALEVVAPEPEEAITLSELTTAPELYSFAVRTNLLYDALLFPTLGIEWRPNANFGVKLDGALAWWGGAKGDVQKMWMLSPEARWYMGNAKRFYMGIGGNYGKVNLYGYPMGNLLSSLYTKDTGYQGSFWNAGATVGYQLKLARALSLDFNLGLGYTRFNYDTFEMIGNRRIFKTKDQRKNAWSPTQAGVSLIWGLGK